MIYDDDMIVLFHLLRCMNISNPPTLQPDTGCGGFKLHYGELGCWMMLEVVYNIYNGDSKLEITSDVNLRLWLTDHKLEAL